MDEHGVFWMGCARSTLDGDPYGVSVEYLGLGEHEVPWMVSMEYFGWVERRVTMEETRYWER